MERSETEFPIRVGYDSEEDILTFNFTRAPEAGIAEEAADEVWIRFNPDTRRVLTIDVLNFSKRVHEVFGAKLLYSERTDPERIVSLAGLPPASDSEQKT